MQILLSPWVSVFFYFFFFLQLKMKCQNPKPETDHNKLIINRKWLHYELKDGIEYSLVTALSQIHTFHEGLGRAGSPLSPVGLFWDRWATLLFSQTAAPGASLRAMTRHRVVSWILKEELKGVPVFRVAWKFRHLTVFIMALWKVVQRRCPIKIPEMWEPLEGMLRHQSKSKYSTQSKSKHYKMYF